MYQIGIVSFEESTAQLEKLNDIIPNEWKLVSFLPSENLLFDLIILRETNSDQVGKICNQLLKFKNEDNSLIWIWSTIKNETNRIIYLNLGVDEIVTSDIRPEEWILLANNALKHRELYLKQPHSNKNQVQTTTKFILNSRNRSMVINNNCEISLTTLEYTVMDVLFKNDNELVTYGELYHSIYGEEEFEVSNYYRITNLVFHIRKKIKESGETDKVISTIRSKGYRLTV